MSLAQSNAVSKRSKDFTDTLNFPLVLHRLEVSVSYRYIVRGHFSGSRLSGDTCLGAFVLHSFTDDIVCFLSEQ